MEFKKGQRVRDKFKLPKPGDESVTGVITSVKKDEITVTWDNRQVRVFDQKSAEALLVIEP